jgi:NAD(P) transhydrogenase subunit alpha
MILGILKEKSDKRVSLVPRIAKKFQDLGVEVMIESGAGTAAGHPDSEYEGCKIVSGDDVVRQADVIVSIHPPADEELNKYNANQYLISSFAPFIDAEVVGKLDAKNLNAFSMDMIPRTTLAQAMDVLSSMASIAGYKAVLRAASYLHKYFPMMITAAGSIKPAKILVLGAGVAGLQAIATAKRLGAVVEVFDTRSAVKEEVQSLGGRFIEVEGAREDAEAGGYAVEQTEEFLERQRKLVQEKAAASDVIITTAQVRGRKAPILVPKETVDKMQPGSVIVDLAASTGGNCELTEDNKIITSENGVIIIGDSNLAADMPQDASFLYANNLFNFLKPMIKEGNLEPNMEDEIVSSSLITKQKS